MTAIAEPGFVSDLGSHGTRPALITASGGWLSYRELDRLVSAAAERLGPMRRLVLLAARNDVDSLVTYLAALRGAHPVLLAASDQVAGLTAAYDPDVVIDGPWHERRQGTAHNLHPDLALLLSTSGSTGSPRLVRLSADGLLANAGAIADYLDIRPTDRAITSLPVHYCYGLSVVNSNLLRGAAIVLTDRSVTDPAFWALVRDQRVTSLHGVPHTFGLLDSVGFARMELPSLRYLTQAGGRLDPATVSRYAALGEDRGWRLFVMYGQTEATARMAYLPPELARANPSAIGVPIPGGELRIVGGELVYRGPNVMLGYAEGPADLALGRTTLELRTGDLGRRTAGGLFEVTGRASRFVKPFGLRVDLDQVERMLAAGGIKAACAGTDEALVIAVLDGADTGGAVPEGADTDRAGRLVRASFGLPHGSVAVHRVDRFPRLPSGKIDYPAVTALRAAAPEPATGSASVGSVRQAFGNVFGRREVPGGATFVGLGGDSLSYVQLSVALERVLGDLPPDWPTTPVAELERRRPIPRRVPMVDTSIVLRALAIVLVVGSHIKFFDLTGGAHLLLVIAGWNFARFLLPGSPARIGRSAAIVALPAVAWLGYRAAVTDDVALVNVLLVNGFAGSGASGYWFVEVLVHGLLVLAIVFALPAVRRAERAHGFAFALAVLAATLALRAGIGDAAASFAERNMTTIGASWFFALGWLAHRATGAARKLAVLGLAAVLIPGTFGDPSREAIVLAGLILLVALARVPLPRPAVGVVSLVASASLYIYLTHYAVYPVLLAHLPAGPVVLLSVAAGVLAWQAARLTRSALTRLTRSALTCLTRPHPPGPSSPAPSSPLNVASGAPPPRSAGSTWF